MPDIKGRFKYKGFVSPQPHKTMNVSQKRYLAKVYGELRSKQFKGENPIKKEKAAKIAWSIYNKKYHSNYYL